MRRGQCIITKSGDKDLKLDKNNCNKMRTEQKTRVMETKMDLLQARPLTIRTKDIEKNVYSVVPTIGTKSPRVLESQSRGSSRDQKTAEMNPLHGIRMRERRIRSRALRQSLEERNQNLERKRLSSAYSKARSLDSVSPPWRTLSNPDKRRSRMGSSSTTSIVPTAIPTSSTNNVQNSSFFYESFHYVSSRSTMATTIPHASENSLKKHAMEQDLRNVGSIGHVDSTDSLTTDKRKHSPSNGARFRTQEVVVSIGKRDTRTPQENMRRSDLNRASMRRQYSDNDDNAGEKRIRKLRIRDIDGIDAYFVAPLVDLCAQCIADNLDQNLALNALPPDIVKKVIDKASVNLPLQISASIIQDENYWQRCCAMRWSDGQILSFLKSDNKNLMEEAPVERQCSPTPALISKSSDMIAADIEIRLSPPSSEGERVTSNGISQPASRSTSTLSTKCMTEKTGGTSRISSQASHLSYSPPLTSTYEISRSESTLHDSEHRSSSAHPSSHDVDYHGKKTWKQLYLERNLAEFLQNTQSRESISQELRILSMMPEQQKSMSTSPWADGVILKNKKKREEIRLQFSKTSGSMSLSNTHDVQAQNTDAIVAEEGIPSSNDNIRLEKKLVDPSPQLPGSMIFEGKIIYDELHTQHMQPTLNYYLLHDYTAFNSLPHVKFRNRMKCLLDGNDGRNTSRLRNIGANDDIFTFYDNATWAHDNADDANGANGNTESPPHHNMQFWLLTAENPIILSDQDAVEMLKYVETQNLKKLTGLCEISQDFVTSLELPSFRARLDVEFLFQHLPKLCDLSICYGVTNAGMSFDINMPGMSANDCKSLSGALSTPGLASNLRSLQLSENQIDDVLVKDLLAGVAANGNLKKLDLSKNKLGVHACYALEAYIAHDNVLQYLNLSDNFITQDGGTLLGRALERNSTLTHLHLRMNRLGDKGAFQLVDSIAGVTSLTFLDLAFNEIDGPATVRSLSQSLSREGFPLLHLDLSGNVLCEEGCNELMRSCLNNFQICSLEMRRTSADRYAMRKISQVISRNMKGSTTSIIDERQQQ